MNFICGISARERSGGKKAKVRCERVFDSLDELLSHVDHYHRSGRKKAYPAPTSKLSSQDKSSGLSRIGSKA